MSDPMVLIAIVVLAAFFLIMLRYRPKPTLMLDRRDFAYEMVVEPAGRAPQPFRIKFGDVSWPDEERIFLIRLGFFNRGREALTPSDFIRPMVFEFPEGSEILKAEFAESFKHRGPVPAAPIVSGTRIEFPAFPLDSLGAHIFNLAVRDAYTPTVVDGAIEGQDEIKRLE